MEKKIHILLKGYWLYNIYATPSDKLIMSFN